MNLINCADYTLPQTNFDDCNPDANFSEIVRVLLAAPKAAPFANIQNKNEWLARLSETTQTQDAIRALTVIGDQPAAADVSIALSNRRTKVLGKNFTINYTVDDISAINDTFFANLDEQPLLRLFGYETYGGFMYIFGNTGRIVNHTSNRILARGNDAVENENGVITWQGKRPTRIISPIFEGDEDSTPITFDSQLITATDATPGPVAQVSGTASSVDAEQKLQFNAQTNIVGGPASMNIKVGGGSEFVVDFRTDYLGSPFKYTDRAGVVHTGNFVDGIVNF